MTPPPQKNIEDILCFKTRIKILKVLVGQQLTPSEVARAVGCNYVHANRHIEELEAEGILTHVNFGSRIRYYKFAESNKAQAVKNLIESWLVPARP